MSRAALCASLLLLGAACSEDARPAQGTPSAQVVHYGYGFDLASAEARVTLQLQVEQPGEGCVALASALPLRELSAPGLQASQDGGTVALCGRFEQGAALQLSARTQVPLRGPDSLPGTQVGLTRLQDASGHPFTYLLSWVEACPLLGPCDPAASRLAHFELDVSHGPDDVVLCPGTRDAQPTRTRCALLGTQAPTYSALAVAANPAWVRTPMVEAAGVSVVLYEVPGGRVGAALPAAEVGDFLAWISSQLSPFPYGDELRVATGPTAWMGMEHPANVLLSETLPDLGSLYQRPALHALRHELVHQWAGDRTTLASPLDFAWKEAVAEYLAYVYEDERGLPGEAAQTRALWRQQGRGAGYAVRPLEDPGVPLSAWSPSTYGAGPLALLLQLEPLLGRPALLTALRALLASPGARSVEDLRRELERASGADLRAYFDAWVYGRGEPEWPQLAVSAVQAEGQVTLTVTQSQGAGVRFPLAVQVELEGGPARERVELRFPLGAANTTATATVPFAQALERVTLDPEKRVLARVRGALPEPAAPPLPRWHP
nr:MULTISPECIES: M1 family aminopeptidase [Myxococcaceae]